MTTAQAPVRSYKFTDGRLIELCLEKIAFAERDATELATIGVTAIWVSDFEDRALAFGAMPTDTIELGEQVEATEQKEAEANALMDKLKELRSAAKRALGEKSVEYRKFGFLAMDRFRDSDLLRLALVIPALTTKHAAALATKGWIAADNTELQDMLTEFVTGIQNQAMEIGSRDSAAADRITEGNAIFDLLANELCEAGKGYWRTISEAKFNDYEIYNTVSGGTLTTVIREGDLNSGVITRINTDGFSNTPTTSALFEAVTTPFRVYAAVNVTDFPGAEFFDVYPGTPVTHTPAELAALLGLGEAKPNLMIQNIGGGIGHRKVTFNNVIEE